MWIGLFCIFACYGVSIFMLHLLFGTRQRNKKKPAAILLVTKNNQNQIEWIIRSLFFFSRVKGNQVTATVIDEGSSDDTRAIIERLSKTYSLELREQSDYDTVDRFLSQHDDDPVVIVHLHNRDDLMKVPVI